MKIFVLFTLLLCFPLYSSANESDRENIAIEIFNATHLTEQLNSQIAIMKDGSVENLSRAMFNKAISDNPKSSKIPKDKAIAVMTNFVKRNMNAITAEKLLVGMAKVYAEGLSDDELKTILAYYKSPIGQKDVASAERMGAALTESMLRVMRQQIEQSFGDLVRELSELSKENQ